jgi:sulfite reductase beta subunit-like hemoprotein
MTIADDPTTFGRTRLSFADEAEIDHFVATLERFERGEITPDEWRAYRLVRGTYGQRQAGDAQMMRVKIPQGILDATQLHALADVAEKYSRGFGHITTRQNLQFHFVALHDVPPAMRHLADAGLTTREACGNSVRNITACPYAGVAADEVFDVTPYALALTRFLLRHELSSALPRKFKIAFEGCGEDHALTAINDIGWRARVRVHEGVPQRGFRVTIGGGTSTLPKAGDELYEFLPAGDMLDVAEAILRVYHRLGDYKHKQKNRMKFLIRSLGFATWRAEFEKALSQVRDAGGVRLSFDPEAPPVEAAPDWSRPAPPPAADVAERAASAPVHGPGIIPRVSRGLVVLNRDYLGWTASNVRLQKQEGYAIVAVTVPLGDLTGAQFRVLADLAQSYGDGAVRVTHDQNLLLRWISVVDVPALYERLAAASLSLPGVHSLADVTSCPGAETCRIAVTQSRGLGQLLGEHLRARPDVVAEAPGLRIKISGCPNGCGQHHIAGIGFQGSVRKLGDKVVPQYFVMLGGGVDEGRAKGVLADLETLTLDDASPEDFIDLGEQEEFKVETQEGECMA